MEVKELVPVDYANQRVILTAQLAAKYQTTPKHINDNFQRAKAQFIEGIHHFRLSGEPLAQFRLYTEKNGVQISSRARSLYLWTEQGALLHCKMLNTDKAWEVFKGLSNFYFAHRDDNLAQINEQLKVQIAQLKQENQAFKAARPNFKPQPIPMDEWMNFLFGDKIKFQYVDPPKKD